MTSAEIETYFEWRIVVVDEAYIEFVESLNGIIAPSLQLVKKYPNVVVMRTLSKWLNSWIAYRICIGSSRHY